MEKNPVSKVLAILLILSLAVCGCETLKNAFCSPTAEQIVAAGEKLGQAESTLAFLLELVPVPEVATAIAALQIAIPILRKIKDGACVTPEDEVNANQVTKSSLTYAGALGYRGGT
jgi:hypothetical protein